MIQPIRPNDATGVYGRQITSADSAAEESPGEAPAIRRAGGRSDRVTISERAQELRRLLAAASGAPDVREARIADIRQQLAEGGYQLDITGIAERLVDEGLLGSGVADRGVADGGTVDEDPVA